MSNCITKKIFKMPFLVYIFLPLFLVMPDEAHVTCPLKCTCSKNFKMITCIKQKLSEIPANIPTTCTELYLSHNSLTTIRTSAFVNLTNLTQLGLNNNKLQTLEDGAFKGLQNLKELYLSTNQLSDVNAQLFQNLTRLNKLYLANNLLTQIPKLSTTTSLVILGLDTNKLSSARFPEGFANLTLLSTIDLTNNPQLTAITWADFESLSNTSIRAINIGRCRITRVDPLSKFVHLQSLTLSYNPLSIEAIRNISNSNFTDLTSLKIDGSINGTIPADLFKNLSGVPLKHLFLANSKLSGRIVSGTFDYFPMLETLDLSVSGLSNIDEDVFGEKLKSLKSLLLSNNKFSVIPKMKLPALQILHLERNVDLINLKNLGFQGLDKLDQLILSSCGIQKVEKNSFVGLSSLTRLDLSHNKIGGNSIPAAAFQSLSHLVSLDLSNNNMGTVATEHDLFSYLSQLKKLDMSSNDCTNMSLKLFQPLQQLTELDLSSNQLSGVIASDRNGQLFEGLIYLQRISIRSNALFDLPPLLVKNTTALEFLDVSWNALSSWPANIVLPSKSDTVMIDFTGNKITTVSKLEFEPLAESVHLNLTSNPFACSCDLMWFRRWISANNHSAIIRLENLTNYICSSPQAMHNKRLLEFNPDDIQRSCNPPPWMWILVGVGAAVFAIMLFAFLMGYRYRWPLRLKWYRLRVRMGTSSSLHGPYEPFDGTEYDIMVSYGPSERDTNWVKDKLVPMIDKVEVEPVHEVNNDEPRLNSIQSTEEDSEQQVTNHSRDMQQDRQQAQGYPQLNGAEPSVNSNEPDEQRWHLFFEEKNIDFNKPVIGALADAITRSNKVLIILSKDYLRDSRRRFEVQLAVTAHVSCLDRIILISLDPDADLRMPSELHPIAERNRVLCWTWNDADAESFWIHLCEEIRRPVVNNESE